MARDNKGKFLPGESGNTARQFAPGNPHRFQPGQSGNPAGKPRSRAQFESALVDAITTEGSAEEVAKLLWEAARRGEPWAMQNLLLRFFPATQTLKIETDHNDCYDFSQLSNEQLNQLEQILEAAAGAADTEGGASPPQLP